MVKLRTVREGAITAWSDRLQCCSDVCYVVWDDDIRLSLALFRFIFPFIFPFSVGLAVSASIQSPWLMTVCTSGRGWGWFFFHLLQHISQHLALGGEGVREEGGGRGRRTDCYMKGSEGLLEVVVFVLQGLGECCLAEGGDGQWLLVVMCRLIQEYQYWDIPESIFILTYQYLNSRRPWISENPHRQ